MENPSQDKKGGGLEQQGEEPQRGLQEPDPPETPPVRAINRTKRSRDRANRPIIHPYVRPNDSRARYCRIMSNPPYRIRMFVIFRIFR